MVTLGQKLKMQKKHAKNVCTITLQLFYAKNGSKKTANIRKMRAF